MTGKKLYVLRENEYYFNATSPFGKIGHMARYHFFFFFYDRYIYMYMQRPIDITNNV